MKDQELNIEEILAQIRRVRETIRQRNRGRPVLKRGESWRDFIGCRSVSQRRRR
jgi:hypothetical protein